MNKKFVKLKVLILKLKSQKIDQIEYRSTSRVIEVVPALDRGFENSIQSAETAA
jgi:hypothetical protein